MQDLYLTLINRDVLLISVIVFSLVYVIRIIIKNYWDNSIVQRFIIIIPLVVGGVVGYFWSFSDVQITGANKVAFGLLGAIFSMIFYKFLKDILGGKDFFEIVYDFINSKSGKSRDNNFKSKG